jgi:adenylate cyclase class 2
MNIEYEATFTKVDKDDIRGKLLKLGATKKRDMFLMKRITLDLPSEKFNSWMRVRDEDGKVTMTYKSLPDGERTIESQKELEVEVSDFETAVSMLDAIGCIKKAYQENKRELWDVDGVEVAIDEWPFLEPFIEVEGENEEVVRNVSERLGFDWKDALFGSTDEQYAEKYNVTCEFVCRELKRIAFGDPNPFIK